MARPNFEQQLVDRINRIREQNAAVMRESVQRVIALAQEPGPSVAGTRAAIAAGAGLGRLKKNGSRGVSRRALGPIPNRQGGGLLPVDTGFLRASLVTFTGEAPPPQALPKPGRTYRYNASAVSLAIAAWDFKRPFTAAYTAAYARHVHYGANGRPARPWVTLAAQRFPQIVAAVAAEAKALSK